MVVKKKIIESLSKIYSNKNKFLTNNIDNLQNLLIDGYVAYEKIYDTKMTEVLGYTELDVTL